MKRLIVGIVIGLALGAAPSIADWSYGDYGVLQQISTSLTRISDSLEKQAQASLRIATALEKQADKYPDQIRPCLPAEDPGQRSKR